VIQPQPQALRVRFDHFELDCGTGELFKNGLRLKLQDQPARLLLLLVNRAGMLVTRDEIQEALWEKGQFVEFEHAINVAVKKVREALEDDPVEPRWIETLPRKGYRFIGPVEAIRTTGESPTVQIATPDPPIDSVYVPQPEPRSQPAPAAISVADDEETLEREFALAATPARILFLAVQAMYLTVYCLVLLHMGDVDSVLAEAGIGWLAEPVLIGAAGSIPVRLYLAFAVGLKHPAAGIKYRRMLPYLMPWDWIWAPAPFLAVHAIGPEWALVFSALLVYPPVSQLILMRSIDHHKNRPGPEGL
jgi:cholera toxin transcriptional activator